MDLLIDGDPIVYGCGFAADKESNSAPESHAIQNCRMLINQIERDLTHKVRQSGDTSPIRRRIYLTGSGNYREGLATIRKYKGNRDPLHKPVHYAAIRRWLLQSEGAMLVEGREADDAIASFQYQADHESTIICTIDKDLLMVPGLHYNYRKKTMQVITAREARRTFWKSVLAGDPVDNIGGCYKVGPKKAERVISALDGIANLTDFNHYAYHDCMLEYADSLIKHGAKTGYANLGSVWALEENARLLWMQEYPGQLWVPPGAEAQYLPGYGP